MNPSIMARPHLGHSRVLSVIDPPVGGLCDLDRAIERRKVERFFH